MRNSDGVQDSTVLLLIISGILVIAWTPAGFWLTALVVGVFLLWVGFHAFEYLWSTHLLHVELREAKATTPQERTITWESLQRSRPHAPTPADTADQVTAILQSVTGPSGTSSSRPGS